MMVGTRLLLRVAKVTSTVAAHSVRPPTKIRTQLGPVRCGRVGGSRATIPRVPSVAVCVMAPLLVLGPRVAPRPAGVFHASGQLPCRLAGTRSPLLLPEQPGHQVDGGGQDHGAQ